MDKVKISVIIPIYNCQDYLRQCLDSVMHQTLKELEIICVDDGSTDASYDILQSYAKKYAVIRVFQQVNSGAGATRNLGLENAVGEFVAFLDADDYYLDEDALEKMYCLCKQKGVSICGSFGKVIEGNRLREANFFDIGNMSTEVVYQYNDFQMDCGYTTFIYKRRLLKKYNIHFPLYRRFQDPPFMVKAMYLGQEFVMADTSLYCYRAPNLVNRLNQDKTIDLIKGLQDNLNFALNHHLEKLFKATLYHLEYDYAYLILYNLSMSISDKNKEILLLLLGIQEMVQSYFDDRTYILRILQMMMAQAASYAENYERLLDDKLEKLSSIVIYGAGKYAKNFLGYLKRKGYIDKVKYIVVSNMKNNDSQLHGKTVVDLDTYLDKCENMCIFVAVSSMYQQDISDRLTQRQYTNFELMDDSFLGRIG